MGLSILLFPFLMRYILKKRIQSNFAYSYSQFMEYVKTPLNFDMIDFNIDFAYNVYTDKLEIIRQERYDFTDILIFRQQLYLKDYYRNEMRKEQKIFFTKIYRLFLIYYFITLILSVAYNFSKNISIFMLVSHMLCTVFIILEFFLAHFHSGKKITQEFPEFSTKSYIIFILITDAIQTLLLYLCIELVLFMFLNSYIL